MKVEVNDDQSQKTEPLHSSSKDVHFLDLLTILSRRRRFILFFTGGATLLAVIAVLVIPSEYTADAVVLPPGQNSSGSSALLSQLGGGAALSSVAGASLGIRNPSEMYVSLFRIRTVEDSMVQRFGLMTRYHAKQLSGARGALEAHSKVVLGTKDGLLTISVTDRDPKQAAEMANGYVEEFRKLTADIAITEASQRRNFFQQQLLEANENLATAEEAMKHTEQSTGILQIDSQARSLIETAATLRGQISAKEVELQAMRSFATNDNPQMVIAEQQLIALKGELAKLAGTDANPNSEVLVPKGNIPAAGMEYIRKMRDVKYYETITELIARQFEMAKLDEARQGAVIQVVDPAMVPDHRSFPRRSITVILVFLLGFLLSCGWCLFAYGLERMKQDPANRQRLDDFKATFRK
jgi:uncharacterized protein involved in exopolysaccharide biosynthesis